LTAGFLGIGFSLAIIISLLNYLHTILFSEGFI
jgi:hypothetical protein